MSKTKVAYFFWDTVYIDGACYTSAEIGIYGSDVLQRSYWGGDFYSAWLDYSNSLPAGLLQRFYVFAQPAASTAGIGTAISRIQIWRPSPSRSLRRAFQLVWERRILVLPCNRTHGALLTVRLLTESIILHVFVFYTLNKVARWRKVACSTPGRGAIKVNLVNSAFHPSRVGKSSTGLHGWG